MNSVFVIKEIIPCNSEPVNLDNLVQILNQSPISPTTKRNSTSHGFLRINSEISSDGFTRYFFGYYSYYKTEYVKTVKEKNLLKNTEIKDKVTKNIEYICLEATSGNCEKRHFIAFKVLTSDLNLKKEFEEHFNQIFAAKHELKKIKPNSFLFEILNFKEIHSISTNLRNKTEPRKFIKQLSCISNIDFNIINESFINGQFKDKFWKEDSFDIKYENELNSFLKKYMEWNQTNGTGDSVDSFIKYLKDSYSGRKEWDLNEIAESIIMSAYCKNDMSCTVGGKLKFDTKENQHIHSILILDGESHFETTRKNRSTRKLKKMLIEHIHSFLQYRFPDDFHQNQSTKNTE